MKKVLGYKSSVGVLILVLVLVIEYIFFSTRTHEKVFDYEYCINLTCGDTIKYLYLFQDIRDIQQYKYKCYMYTYVLMYVYTYYYTHSTIFKAQLV